MEGLRLGVRRDAMADGVGELGDTRCDDRGEVWVAMRVIHGWRDKLGGELRGSLL